MFALSPDFVGYQGRSRLVQAAWDALVDKDVAELKLSELARAIGVSPQAVHKHFHNKLGLLGEVAAAGLATLHANLDSAAEPSIEDFVVAWIRFAGHRPRHYALMFSSEFNALHGVEFRRAGLGSEIRALCFRQQSAEPSAASVLAVFAIVHGSASLAAAQMDFPAVDTLCELIRAACQLKDSPTS